MAQRVDNEANPEQGQKRTDQATTPTVQLHRTKEDTIEGVYPPMDSKYTEGACVYGESLLTSGEGGIQKALIPFIFGTIRLDALLQQQITNSKNTLCTTIKDLNSTECFALLD